ncbi:hypothetical protein BHK69_15275 [Bosea vaviloviae]|uniref:Uncharacterized protein n=2 Tax=Bosea vaviloviae TaxID=1526658 RepID=A0A1D7U2R5_9HYPH|nr:hypothetical protein BHK69_15275 [Bosea vaviloviae]
MMHAVQRNEPDGSGLKRCRGGDVMPKAISTDGALDGGDNDAKPVPTRFRPLHGFLKLIVETDSSRSVLSRFRAGTILLALLAAFGGVGYFLPAFLSRYF